MRAEVGDRLVSASGSGSVGLIVAVLGAGGQPPYVVKWQRTGHIAMVVPDPYARIIPAGHPAGTQGDWAAGGSGPVPDQGGTGGQPLDAQQP